MENEATQARNGLASCFSSDAHNISYSRAIDSFIKCTISGDLQQQATNSNSYGRRCKQQIFMEGEATETRNGLGFCFSSDAHKSVFFLQKKPAYSPPMNDLMLALKVKFLNITHNSRFTKVRI